MCIRGKFLMNPNFFTYSNVQYSELADEVRGGRGKVPVADYKIADYVDGDYSSGSIKRSCYSFCMCPGGQVKLLELNSGEAEGHHC